jgi:hypothetical protein
MLSKKEKASLYATVVEQTKANGYAVLPQDKANELDPEKVELNAAVAGLPDGHIGVRALDISTVSGASSEQSAPKERPVFTLDSGIVKPAMRRGGAGNSMYPFAQMQPGQSFFVPVSAAMPNVQKTFPSIVSSAARRFGKPTGQTRVNAKGKTVQVLAYDRKFSTRSVEENGVKGVRVWRDS